jgi:hypothetical protein
VKLGRHWIPIPQWIWHRVVARHARTITAGLGFMSPDHHRVRNFAVRELPRVGEPLSAQAISESLGLSVDRVEAILDDLAQNMTFVCLDGERAITWAYPVTVEATPHHLAFETGERMTAA